MGTMSDSAADTTKEVSSSEEELVEATDESTTAENSSELSTTNKTLPRRFRTAFILFSSARHKEIREQLGQQGKSTKTANISKIVSNDWRSMAPEEKQEWEDKARTDKDRYDAEMAHYKEIMKQGGTACDMPKRPMSAFLAFSNQRRAALKRVYPDATNAELSKMLSKAWKEAPPMLKNEYVEDEARLRAQYTIDMIPWRNKKPRKKRVTTAKNLYQKLSEKKEASSSAANRMAYDPLMGTLGFTTQSGKGSNNYLQQQNLQVRSLDDETRDRFGAYFQTNEGLSGGNEYVMDRTRLGQPSADRFLLVPRDYDLPGATGGSTQLSSMFRASTPFTHTSMDLNQQDLYASQLQTANNIPHHLEWCIPNSSIPRGQALSQLQEKILLENTLAGVQSRKFGGGLRDLPSLYRNGMKSTNLYYDGAGGSSALLQQHQGSFGMPRHWGSQPQASSQQQPPSSSNLEHSSLLMRQMYF